MLTIDNFPYRHDIEIKDPDIQWIFTGRWSPLDNFFLEPIYHDGVIASTSEHMFAAMKAAREGDYFRILAQPDPGRAKALGRSVEMRPDWDEIKFQRMYEIVKSKMEQSTRARKCLRDTGERRIYEGNTWNDDIWGVVATHGAIGVPGSRFSGRNALGEILMLLRSEMF